MSTVFVKSADGGDVWEQFTPQLVADLHARGLRACAWQFVYGADPQAEASAAVASIAAGADCFVIDAETKYEGRYASAQRYLAALRVAIGPAYPLGFTSFPYVDYHPRLPYSVFLGPGGAQANLPQVYWKAIGGSVDAVSAKTVANNRIYGTPIAPLGQSYDAPTGRRPAPLPRAVGRLRRGRAVVVELAGDRRRGVGGAHRARAGAGRAVRSRLARARPGRDRRPGHLAAAAPRLGRSVGRARRQVHGGDEGGAAGLPDRARAGGRPARPTRRRGRRC